MAYCCVPGCTSKQGKPKNVSFHEIPNDIELRKKWLAVISRKDWIPNSTSNYSRVCSLHFTPNDYKQNTKKKCLLKNAVPSQFPHYPSYMQPSIKKMRSMTSIEKRNKSQDIHKQDHFSHYIKNSSLEQINNESNDKKNKQTQVDFFQSEINANLKSLQIRYEKNLKKLQNLQKEFDICRQELLDHKNNFYIKSFKKLLLAAEAGEIAAIILKDLVCNYNKNRPTFEDTTIRHSIIWRATSRKGYEYGRRNLKLKLPARSTLQRYIGNI